MSSYCSPTSLMAMAVCFLNIPTLLLMLRFVVRRLQKMALGLDDWLIVPAWLLMVAICVNVVAGVAYDRLGVQLGQSSYTQYGDWAQYVTTHSDVDNRIAQAEQFQYVVQVLSPGALTFAKLSVLFFYRRMLCPEGLGPFHKMTMTVIILTAIWGVLFTFIHVFQCGTQWSELWYQTDMTSEVCLTARLDFAFTGTDALFDIGILILPIRKILSLRLPTSKKIAILGAFGVGGLTTAISIVRFIMTFGISGAGYDGTFDDEAMNSSRYIYWGLFEVGTAVIVACLPSLQYLFRRFLPDQVRKTAQNAAASGSKASASPFKSAERLEKASVMTESTTVSRRPSIASTMPVFNSRPGTPMMEQAPPLPEAPAASFNGFHSRTATLTSERPSMSSGTATPVSTTAPQAHKRTPSSWKSDYFGGELSPVSRTGSVNSQTPLVVEVKY